MRTITYCEALNEAYREEMKRDKSVYLIGEDVGRWGNLFGASKGLLEEFGPDQVKDAPISEAAIAGCVVGSAALGMRPIAEIMYIDFITIAMDQIVNHAAKYHQLSCGTVKMPVVAFGNSSVHSLRPGPASCGVGSPFGSGLHSMSVAESPIGAVNFKVSMPRCWTE